jgi:DNA-directed RNA polymerase subunit RPC12/RpoP
MANATYFVQECPTCGRRLEIRVEYLGKRVVCQHCQGKLLALDPCGARGGLGDQGSALLHRADELLKSVAQRRAQLGGSSPP